MLVELVIAERAAARRERAASVKRAGRPFAAAALPLGTGRFLGAALLVLLALVGCGSDLPDIAPGACECPAVMDPVCAVDGRTYASACALDCARAAFDHWGHCGRDAVAGDACSCSRLYEPECGMDGVSYLNACARTCAGAAWARDGLCSDGAWPCGCPTAWAPVCGGNGVTYPNECVLGCMDVSLDHSGSCP